MPPTPPLPIPQSLQCRHPRTFPASTRPAPARASARSASTEASGCGWSRRAGGGTGGSKLLHSLASRVRLAGSGLGAHLPHCTQLPSLPLFRSLQNNGNSNQTNTAEVRLCRAAAQGRLNIASHASALLGDVPAAVQPGPVTILILWRPLTPASCPRSLTTAPRTTASRWCTTMSSWQTWPPPGTAPRTSGPSSAQSLLTGAPAPAATFAERSPTPA